MLFASGFVNVSIGLPLWGQEGALQSPTGTLPPRAPREGGGEGGGGGGEEELL